MPPPPVRALAPVLGRALARALLAAVATFAASAVAGAQAAPGPLPGTGSLAGVVHDSLLADGPLADAEVWIDGTTLTARTDRLGRFRFDAVPAGRHRVAFVHPALDAQRIGAPVATVDVAAGAHAELRLATPAAAAVHAALCPGVGEARTGLLLGLAAPPGAPGVAADVTASWVVWTVGRGGLQAAPRELAARADGDGAFRLCGVPTDVPVQLRAESPDGAVAVTEVAFGGRAVALAVVPMPVAPASEGDASSSARAAVQGRVRTAAGLPVAGAEVRLVDGAAPAVALTREDGTFALRELPAGARTLEARAIGLRPARVRLALAAGRTTAVALTLGGDATVLAATRVTARRESAMVEGFERRLAAGRGRFVTRADIERRQALTTTELVALVPGVRVVPGPQAFDGAQIAFLRTLTGPLTNAGCRPLLYLDGTRVMMPLDALVRPQELYGIEVHASTATMPPEYAGPNAGCGVVLLWTRRSPAR